MPAIVDKLRLTRKYDKRYRFTEQDYEDMKKLYEQGMSLRAIARKYKTHHSVISTIVNPKKKEYQKQWWHEHYQEYKKPDGYMTEYHRDYRKRKRELHNKGLI